MPKLRAENSSQAIELQALWIAASRAPKRIVLTFPEAKDAHSMRYKLYNAVRNARKDPGNYPVLYEASMQCSIEVEDNVLTIGRRELTPLMIGLLGQLEAQGVVLDGNLLQHPKQREEQALGERLAQRFAAPAEATAADPADIPVNPGSRRRAVEDFMARGTGNNPGAGND